LLDPAINEQSSKALHRRLMRWLFRRNLRFARHVVVQTGVMKEQLAGSHNISPGLIAVIPQPAPDWFTLSTETGRKAFSEVFTLFCPATLCPHKNHVIFEKLASFVDEMDLRLKAIVTVPRSELPDGLQRLPWPGPVGRASGREMERLYREVDGLFFPSWLETYGLSLVEAMTFGLPVACSNLPYARRLCEEQACYFDPNSGRSAAEAIRRLRRQALGKPDCVNWGKAPAKLPRDWDEVAARMVELMAY